MGLFNKLKQNLDHGGVKVHLQAPSSVPSNQVIPVSVTVEANSPQTINSLKVELKVEMREQGMSLNGGYNSGRTTAQTVAQVESREPFSLGANESKTVQLELYLGGNNASPMGPLGALGGGGALGGALKAAAALAGNFENVSRLYSLHAHVDVANISIDPSDKQPIQILPPAEQAPSNQPAAPTNNPPQQIA